MIPREILKKIRQIELRTNRNVTGLSGSAPASGARKLRELFQPTSRTE
jgi:hypothetical protein